MPQKLLHLVDVHPAAQHVRCEAVAQRVRRHAAPNSRVGCVALEDEPEALAGQPLAAAIDEQSRLVALANEPRSCEADVFSQLLHRLIEQGNLALTVALAQEADVGLLTVEVDVTHVE